MARETGKQRKSRIDLDYYRQDRTVRRRGRLGVLAALGALIWIGLGPVWDRRHPGAIRIFQQDRLASPGSLARVHATWESNCEACHHPYAPVNESRWSPLAWLGARAGDTKCQSCHAGPPHHVAQLEADTPACAACHRDHRGPESSLVRTEDETCTRCHENLLGTHRKPTAGSLSITDSVTRFDHNRSHHPEFAAISRGPQSDPGHLEFSHAVHLASGFNAANGGKPLMTYSQLRESDRLRYGGKNHESRSQPVQLECAMCHRLDGEENRGKAEGSSRAGIPGRSDGAYFLPMTYEHDCAACHSLHFDPKAPSEQVRHGLTPRALLAELRRFYEAQASRDDPALLRRFVPPRPMPGQRPDAVATRVDKAIEEKVGKAMGILLGQNTKGCIKCHDLEPAKAPPDRPDAIAQTEVVPVNVPAIWFQHARFDHVAHRALKCETCHAGVERSRDHHDVLLPGIATCLQCHGPAGSSPDGSARGGASSGCTECHRYHNGDHPLQGLGASARGVPAGARLSVEQFQRGETINSPATR
jgi:predicted CXXCH cytochrome family protein